MNGPRPASVVALFFGLAATCAPTRGDDAFTVLRMVPSDLPIVAVVVDFEKLDEAIKSFSKRLGDDVEIGLDLEEVRGEMEIGPWIDFSRPFAVGLAEVGDDEQTVFWACVPDFATKIKARPGAIETEGVWYLPSGEAVQAAKTADAEILPPEEGVAAEGHFIKRVKGDYVVASATRSLLEKVSDPKAPLAAELKRRVAIFGDREVWIHLNMEPLRDRALTGLGGIAQMAPMFVMMASAQGGGIDPTTMTAVISGLFDAAKRLVEQIAYVDVALTVDGKSIDATVMSGYKEGPIKTYLTQQKPASIPFLTEIEEQPYFVAMGYHAPGDSSPFIDYIVKTVIDAIPADTAGATDPGTQGQDTRALIEAFQTAAEFYRRVEGVNAVIAMSPDGMKEVGDLIGKDHAGIIDLAKQAMADDNPIMQQFGGAKMEALGTKKIGNVAVEQFSLTFDPASPMAAQTAAMYGQNARYALGVVNRRVRFCLGSDDDIKRAFRSKVSSPLAASPFVKEVMAALPSKRNAVILLDLASAIGSFAAMAGMPATAGPVSPGPPIAISVSLAGEPARLDIHVPARAIERVKQAVAPKAPDISDLPDSTGD